MQFPKSASWFATAAIVVVIFGTIYGTVQQAQRSAANDPQIQLAEDTAAALNAGARPASLVHGRVNLGRSLSPFVIIYTRSSQIVAGSGYLNGHIPCPPLGVLRASQGRSYSAVTWQPQTGVRLAAVTVSAKDYYVVSGRSLQQVEINENRTFRLATFGGLLALVVLTGAYIVRPRAAGVPPKPKRRK